MGIELGGITMGVEKELLDKKLDNYNWHTEDFKIENELMVEITLNEYRKLVREVALKEHDIEEIKQKNWRLESDNAKLQSNVKNLEHLMLRYQTKFGTLQEEDEDYD